MTGRIRVATTAFICLSEVSTTSVTTFNCLIFITLLYISHSFCHSRLSTIKIVRINLLNIRNTSFSLQAKFKNKVFWLEK